MIVPSVKKWLLHVEVREAHDGHHAITLWIPRVNTTRTGPAEIFVVGVIMKGWKGGREVKHYFRTQDVGKYATIFF